MAAVAGAPEADKSSSSGDGRKVSATTHAADWVDESLHADDGCEAVSIGDAQWEMMKTRMIGFSTLDHVTGMPEGYALTKVSTLHEDELEVFDTSTGKVVATIKLEHGGDSYFDMFYIPRSGILTLIDVGVYHVNLHKLEATELPGSKGHCYWPGLLDRATGNQLRPWAKFKMYCYSATTGKETTIEAAELQATVPLESELLERKPLLTRVDKTLTGPISGMSVHKEHLVGYGAPRHYIMLQDGRIAAWANHGEGFGGLTMWDMATKKARFAADCFLLEGNPKCEDWEEIWDDNGEKEGTLVQVGPSMVALLLQNHKYGIVLIDVDRMEQVGLAAEGEHIHLAEAVHVEGMDHAMLVAGTVSPGKLQVWCPVDGDAGWYKKQQEVELGEKVTGVTALKAIPGGKLLVSARQGEFLDKPFEDHPFKCFELKGVKVQLSAATDTMDDPHPDGNATAGVGGSMLLQAVKMHADPGSS